MDNGIFSSMQSYPTSINDHFRYNKSDTCKSWSNSSLSILPPCQHPCQVYMIILLEEGNRFPNLLSIHNHTTTLDSSPLPGHQHSRSCPLRDPSIHDTGSYPLSVLPTKPAVILCAALTSTTPTVVLWQSFHSTYWFSRLRVSGRHHIGAPNLKGVFSRVCAQTDPSRECLKSLVVGSIHGKPVFIHHKGLIKVFSIEMLIIFQNPTIAYLIRPILYQEHNLPQ